MKTKQLFFSIAVFCSIELAHASVTITRIAEDHFSLRLSADTTDSIRILQVTDLHIGISRSWEKTWTTMERVDQLVTLCRPDIIAVTGDLFHGQKTDSEALSGFARVYFDRLRIPWFFTFGNHDPEGGQGREPIRRIFSESEWGMMGSHNPDTGQFKCDYRIDVFVGKALIPVWQMYAFDSGSELGNKSIKKNQLAWFRAQSLKSRAEYKTIVPAVVFFHIPLKQYHDLWQDSTLVKSGEFHETVCLEEDDGSVYQAFLDQGNVQACFCGHDHDNNYWGKYHGGILLVYGHVTGDAGYHRHWPPGGKLISLPLKKGEIGVKDIVME